MTAAAAGEGGFVVAYVDAGVAFLVYQFAQKACSALSAAIAVLL